MADQCKTPTGELVDVLHDTFVLGFRVAGDTLLDSPATVKRVVESDAFKKAVEDALRDAAKQLLDDQAKRPLTVADGTAVVKKVGDAALKAAEGEALKQLKASPGAKQLEGKLADLKCAFDKSPVGVFVSENKTLLYVVAAGVAVAGAGAMYATWSGDELADPLTKLASNAVKFKLAGNLEVGVGKVTFQPSTRTAGAELLATAKWKRAEVKLEMSVTQENGKLTTAGGTGTAVIQLTKPLQLTITGGGGVGPAAGGAVLPRYNAAVALKYTGSGADQGLSVQLWGALEQKPGVSPAGTAGASVGYAPKWAGGARGELKGELKTGGDQPASQYVGGSVVIPLW